MKLAGFIFTIDCTLRASARHLAPLSGTHPQPAHTHAPWPSAEDTKLCSTVVSIDDQAPLTLTGWGEPAPSWCGYNSLVTSAWGGWVQ